MLNFLWMFLPRDAMRKHGLCYGPVSVCLSRRTEPPSIWRNIEGGGKILRFSTEITVYLGNGTSIFLSFFFLIICFIFVLMLRCVNCIIKRIYGYMDMEMVRDRPMVAMECSQEVVCALSNGDIFNDLDGPQPSLQGHDIFEVKYLRNSKKVLGTKLLYNINRKPYPVYQMVPLSMTLIDP